MNLRDVICTSKDGDRFWKLPSCYIRGSAIKFLRLPPDVLEKAKLQDDEAALNQPRGGRGAGHGPGRAPRGGGRGGGRGRGRSSGRGEVNGGRGNSGRGRGGRGRGGQRS